VGIDWGAGSYETTAGELEPVARVVVERAAITGGESVVDVACGTGNGALLAAVAGARVIGVDAAPRLLRVAEERAHAQGAALDLREGDLHALPLDDASADVVISVFGVIFAGDPERALAEVARILRPDGRAVITAWIPAGPIDAMLGAMGQIVGRAAQAPPPPRRFAWHDADALGPVCASAGLELVATTPDRLAIRGASPEAYVAAGASHPMAVAQRPMIDRLGLGAEIQLAMTTVLSGANEDPSAFLVHSPYVVHELRK
jgi:SAM-dependent methyltransferase